MNEEIQQPLPEKKPTSGPVPASESENKKPTQEIEAKTGLKKLMVMLNKISGNSKKTKLIIFLFAFTFLALILAMIASLFQGKPKQTTEGPEPTPTPPVVIAGTPAPTKAPQVTEEVLHDISEFDVEQQDLKPPQLDLEISL